MNYRRVILGGLLAGLVINASEFVLNGVVLAEQMEADMQSAGLVFASWAMPAYVVLGFVWGFFLAWCYAAIRPRYGKGVGTALIAAAALWVVGYLMPSVSIRALGIGSTSNYAISLVWGAAEVVIAAVLAGYIYQET